MYYDRKLKKKINAKEFAELKERNKQLEQTLIQSEIRATTFETMIDVTEKELKINIKKNLIPNH